MTDGTHFEFRMTDTVTNYPSRIGIIGPPGSGKSRLARILSAEWEMRVVELDSFFWSPGWRRRDRDEFLAALRATAGADRVIIVGNYSKFAAHYWSALTAVVWLDLPPHVTFPRLLRRTAVDFATRREVQPGCPQTVRSAAELLKEGLTARRKIGPAVGRAAGPGEPGPVVHRLRSRASVDAFVARARTAGPTGSDRP